MTTIPLGDGGRPYRASHGRGRGTRLLYAEVIDRVEQLIVERGLGPGDRLPSQDELATLTGTSLITVRRALEELQREGRVRRHQGLGTFLSSPKIISDPTHAGPLGSALTSSDQRTEVTTTVLSVERCRPSADLATALQIDFDDDVWEVQRERQVDGRTMILETARIPVKLAPGLDREYRSGSLYETLAIRYGLDDDYEEQFLDLAHPAADVRSRLRLSASSLVVRIRGVTRASSGIRFDVFEQVYPATEFAFVIAGQTTRELHQGELNRDWSTEPVDGSPGPAGPRGRTGPNGKSGVGRPGRGQKSSGSGRTRTRHRTT
ncbi:MAG: GntR family transcriptional regulator [Nocardioides sp.]